MVEDQALDRVYRIGQTKPVTTVRYIVKDTLEEVRSVLAPARHVMLGIMELTRGAQSIRHQQSEKRNLAEQAFDLGRKNHDWVEVSIFLCTLVSRNLLTLSNSE